MNIALAVRDYLASKPFLSEALMDGIINYTGLARKIQPELQGALGIEVRQGAIVMALKRMAPDYYFQVSKGIKGLLKKLGDFTVRSNMVVFTYRNSPTLMSKQKDVVDEVGRHPSSFFSFNQGIYESTIVASGLLDSAIRALLMEEDLIQKKEHLASISIILPKENVEISGLYYFIFKQLAWEDINVFEVISTTNEFTVVVAEEEVEKSFRVLRGLKG